MNQTSLIEHIYYKRRHSTEDPTSQSWIIDSAATSHITGINKILNEDNNEVETKDFITRNQQRKNDR